jgi:hypothetical protein
VNHPAQADEAKGMKRQARMDRFYAEHGPCCAGCDWWRHVNSVAGECIRSAPVAGEQRFTMIGIEWASITPGAGHPYTPRDHRCGEFKDEPSPALHPDGGNPR